MVSALLIMIAAVAMATYETLKDHFTISIFSKLNAQFCNASISHANKYIGGIKANGRVKMQLMGFTFIKPVWLTDAWHPVKSVSIVAFVCAIVFYQPLALNFLMMHTNAWLAYAGELALYGTIFNLTFSLCYTKLFIL